MDLHEFIVPDDLDSYILLCPCCIPGSDYITEHTLTSVAVHTVTLIKLFTNSHTSKENTI